MAQQTPIQESTTEFLVFGQDIQKAIQLRVLRHQNEEETCLTKVATMLKDTVQPGDMEGLASQAAAAMLVLISDEHLTVSALVIQAQLERASFLSREGLDLLCIAKNITPEYRYKVSLYEAKRYGLV